MSKKVRFLIGAIFLFIGFLGFQFYRPVGGDYTHLLHVKRGESTSSIANTLSNRHLIRSPFFFKLYCRLTGASSQLRFGVYEMASTQSVADMVSVLTNKTGSQKLVRVTIPEGFSLKKIKATLVDQGFCTDTEFDNLMANAKERYANDFSFIQQLPISSIEGYLFPDTYLFAKGVSLDVVIYEMLAQFESQMRPIYTAGPIPKGWSLHNALTLAAMIEKESRVPDEMPKIASVFYNRLKIPMRLASDPTVLYALGEPQKSVVLYKDLEVESPYNTYRNMGLPIGPIASPGKKALHAALNPDRTPYLFFVANPDGTHTFTRTYAEHLNVQRRR